MLPEPLLRAGCSLEGPFPQKVSGLTRRKWAAVLHELDYRSGAEIGVRQGAFSEWLCQSIPGLTLRCVDPWSAYRAHPDAAAREADYRVACARLKPYKATICRETSVSAVRRVLRGSLDFVYVDGDHRYSQVQADVRYWSARVRSGGMVAGDDYDAPGVKQAVQEQIAREGIQAWWLMDDPSRKNRKRDVFTSWFYLQV